MNSAARAFPSRTKRPSSARRHYAKEQEALVDFNRMNGTDKDFIENCRLLDMELDRRVCTYRISGTGHRKQTCFFVN